MGLFMEAAGQVAVLIENGVFKQVPVYTRNGMIYAKAAGGFIRLNIDGSTSRPSSRLDVLSYDEPLGSDPLGRLCDLAMVPGARPLPHDKTMRLLGAQ